MIDTEIRCMELQLGENVIKLQLLTFIDKLIFT